ncbi:fibronectin type III domain-containing protein [Patescibacteria group bacterium]|nr:fibronectin type III domain-containing protein [Patescibacteria group bacterium]
MKKFISIIIGLALFIPLASAYYEWTERVDVLKADPLTDNLVILRNGNEKWLIHYNGNCDSVVNNSTTTISIRSQLDESSDYLKLSSYLKCKIDQAEIITGTFYVDDVYTSKTTAIVTDESGKQYEIHYNSRCNGMWGYQNDEVYYYKYRSNLAEGDRLYLPDDEYECQLSYVDLIQESKGVEEAEGDNSVPTTVTGVQATPSDGSVFLSWDEATDNVGVDHYVISYHTYSVNPESYSYSQMPNKTEVDGTNYEITDLDNSDLYYFYVLAVDEAGNMSSDWSQEETATPSSSIRRTDMDEVQTDVNLRITSESAYSFLIEWDKIDSYDRQTILFEVDGERDFVYYDWWKDYMRINKKDSRKGKKLKLIVKEYNIKGSLFEEEIEFDY